MKNAAAKGQAPNKTASVELQRAADCLGAALELSSGAGKIAVALGHAESGAGNHEAAAAAYARAARLQPRYASAHAHLASALQSLGRLTEALASAKQALSLDPADPVALKVVATIQVDPGVKFDCLQNIGQARIVQGNADQLAAWDVSLEGIGVKLIFLQPPAEVVFEVPTGAPGRLTTAVTLHPDVWEKPESGGCEFHIRIDGRVALIVSLDPLNLPFDRRWHEITLDVPESSHGRHQIHFETRAVGKSNDFRWALWRAPQYASQARIIANPSEEPHRARND